MTGRDEIAAALAGVPGVTASPNAPNVANPGMAWPVWQSSAPLTAYGWEITWNVFLVLTGGYPDATIAEADPLALAVGDALLQVGAVTLVEPVALGVDASGTATAPALRFTLTTTN